jgi:hypothetical protein
MNPSGDYVGGFPASGTWYAVVIHAHDSSPAQRYASIQYTGVRNTVWNGRFLHRLLLEKIRQAAYGLVWRQECHSELLCAAGRAL